MTGRSRGMALIQALVVTAAIAAVAVALMQQADRARQRLQLRATADQAGLYLDGGVELVRALLAAIPESAAVHRQQDWARPRDELVIDQGALAFTVADLHGRFDVNTLGIEGPEGAAARAAFVRLATGRGMTRRTAERLADALGPDPRARARATPGDETLSLPLVDPRQLTPLAASEPEAFAALLPFLAAQGDEALLNINTLSTEQWQAWLPDWPRSALSALSARIAETPFESIEDFEQWVEDNLPPGFSEQLGLLPLGTVSTRFALRVEARLDTVVLRRSVVLDRGGLDGRVAVVLSVPETE